MTQTELEAKLKAADKAYYEDDNPTMSDAEYDQLCRQYAQLTGQTWMTLGKPSENLTRVPHSVPMLSLQKFTEPKQVGDWAVESAPDSLYLVTPKIDGVSGALRYQAKALENALTRGDGTVGESILHAIGLSVTEGHIPQTLLHAEEFPDIEIRGEFYLPTDVFESEFKPRGFANPRNTVAGLLRKSGVHPDQKHVRFCAYRAFIPGYGIESQLMWLQDRGFETPPYWAELKAEDFAGLTSEELHPDTWVSGTLPYEIDGVVITVDDPKKCEELGATSKYPRWAGAFKFMTEEVETELLDVEWNASRTGGIVPTYVFRAVQLCGTLVTRATGHNLGQYLQLGAKVGDRIVVRKANEIIPQVMRVVR